MLFADIGLPLAAIRAQLISALDAVVHVARHRGGARRVEVIAEIVVRDDRPAVRALFVREGDALRRRSAPTRAARRPDARPLADEAA